MPIGQKRNSTRPPDPSGQRYYQPVGSALQSGDINIEERTAVLSFSSEFPVKRWFGTEILDHSPKSVRLGRLNDGGPLLLSHNRREQIGVVVKAEIENGRGKAKVRFSRSPKGEEIFQDVIDGIRRGVSVGYDIHGYKEEKAGSDGDSTYRMTDWEPFELSFESVAADPSVGFGRGKETGEDEEEDEEEEEKKEEGGEEAGEERTKIAGGVVVGVDLAGERERVREIIAVGEKHGRRTEAIKAIEDGLTIDQFCRSILNNLAATPTTTMHARSADDIGLSSGEIKGFSFLRAIRAATDGDWSKAGFELEVSKATQKRSGKPDRDQHSFFVPTDITIGRGTRDNPMAPALVTTNAASVIETIVPGGSFIDVLRPKLVVFQMGATVLSGLEGKVQIPRMTAGATCQWIDENNPVPQQTQSLDAVNLSPKSLGAYTDLGRRLLLQSSVDIETYIRNDLALQMAVAIDKAALAGGGTDATKNQPNGIIHQIGAQNRSAGDLTFDEIVALETAVADANADFGRLAYLAAPRVRGYLKTLPLMKGGQSYPRFCWEVEGGRGTMNGYDAWASNVCPINVANNYLFFGNWESLIIGSWGVLDVNVNPWINSNSGAVRVRVLQDLDMGFKYPQGFAYYNDLKVS